MTQNAKINYLKRYKYAIVTLLVFFFCSLILFNYYTKKDLYLLYDDFANCENLKEYEKEIYYGMCYNHNVTFFETESNKKAYKTKNIEKIKLTSKEDFFKIKFNNLKNFNIILIIELDEKYDIIHVKPFKIIS